LDIDMPAAILFARPWRMGDENIYGTTAVEDKDSRRDAIDAGIFQDIAALSM
jgi:hypothetical protein